MSLHTPFVALLGASLTLGPTTTPSALPKAPVAARIWHLVVSNPDFSLVYTTPNLTQSECGFLRGRERGLSIAESKKQAFLLDKDTPRRLSYERTMGFLPTERVECFR